MITFHGASDDVVVVTRDGKAEEHDVIDGRVTFTLTESDTLAGLWLRMEYGEMGDHEGGWCAMVGLNGEGLLIPWDVEIGHHPRVNYSVLVKVDADPRLVLIEKDIPA